MQRAHHAYIYEGALPLLPALAADARERFGFEGVHHPDVHVREFEKFGVDESRALGAQAALRPAGGRALFVVGLSAVTTEAQQALLKLFEEPQQGVMFVLLVPHGTLIETLRSRALPYPPWETPERLARGPAAAFLRAGQKERSEYIAKLLKDDEGARVRVRELLAGLEAELQTTVSEPRTRAALEDIARVRSYVGDRSPSLKMLLEHLALSVPHR